MNWLDLIIILILIGGVASGYKNGFVGEIASLAGLILGIWGAIKFSGWTADLLEGFGLSFSMMSVVAFIITAVIMIFVIPAFKSVFSSFGADLPAPTLVVMAISDWTVANWYILFPAMGGAVRLRRRPGLGVKGTQTGDDRLAKDGLLTGCRYR